MSTWFPPKPLNHYCPYWHTWPHNHAVWWPNYVYDCNLELRFKLCLRYGQALPASTSLGRVELPLLVSSMVTKLLEQSISFHSNQWHHIKEFSNKNRSTTRLSACSSPFLHLCERSLCLSFECRNSEIRRWSQRDCIHAHQLPVRHKQCY